MLYTKFEIMQFSSYFKKIVGNQNFKTLLNSKLRSVFVITIQNPLHFNHTKFNSIMCQSPINAVYVL